MIDGLRPYTKMKDSGVGWLGDVPAHWEVAPVKRRFLIQLGKMLQSQPQNNEDLHVPYLKARNVQWADLDWTDLDRMYASTQEIDQYGVGVGDLLVCEGGEGGRCAVVEHMYTNTVPCIIQNALHRVRPRPTRSESGGRNDFLQYVLSSVSSKGWFNALNNKATIAHLTLEKFGALPVPNPPYSEQTAIVRFLDRATSCIDRYIEVKEKLIKLLEAHKRAIIHEAVTGRIDVRTGRPYAHYKPSGVEWLGAVPEHWDVRPAKWHFREIDERSETGSEELLSVSHLTGVTPRSEKNVTMFEAASNVGHKLCIPGDLVINTMWAWMAALGMARQAGIVSPSYAVYRPINESPLCRDYAELMLRSTPYQSEYKCLSTGIRPSRLRLYPDVFLRIKLICPPPKEQSMIIDFVNQESADTDHAVRLMRKEIATLQEYSACLIADVITGKLDVRDAAAKLPDTEPLAGEHGAHTGRDGPNSHDTEYRISEEVNS